MRTRSLSSLCLLTLLTACATEDARRRIGEVERLSPALDDLVADGARFEVLAEGFHEKKGGPHAEAAALAQLREKSVPSEAVAAATAYVTLEPCTMGPGKTTPACDASLLAAGIRSLQIALLDPDPTFGGGAAFLRSQGVEVTVGAAAEAVRASLVRVRAPYPAHLAVLDEG